MAATPLPSWLDRQEFPFEPSLLPLRSGEALSVTDVGSGPPVVFSHGTPTWSYEWRHLLRGLSPAYRCIAPDHLGFGLSPRPPGADYRPEAHARRFGELMDALGLERATFVLHDYGGPFALDWLLEHPDRVERLVLMNTFAWPFDQSARERRLAGWAGSGLFRFFYRRFNFSFVIAKGAWGTAAPSTPDLWQPYRTLFPDADSRELVLFALARGLAGSADFFSSLASRLARLSHVPVHLIWGLKDTAFPPPVLRRFQAAFPEATTLELRRSGHFPHEEEPEACLASVREFLRRG